MDFRIKKHELKSNHDQAGCLPSLGAGPTSRTELYFSALCDRFILKIQLINICPLSPEHSTCSINVCCFYYYSKLGGHDEHCLTEHQLQNRTGTFTTLASERRSM